MTFLPDPPSGHFEDGGTGVWLPNFYAFGSAHMSVTNSTEQAHGGTHSLKAVLNELYPSMLVMTANIWEPPPPGVDYCTAPGTPGPIAINAWMYTEEPAISFGSIEMYFYEMDGTFVGGGGSGYTPITTGEWSFVTTGLPTLIGGAADMVEIRLWSHQSSSGGDPDLAIGTTTYWDDIGYELGRRPYVRRRQLNAPYSSIRHGQNVQSVIRRRQHDV